MPSEELFGTRLRTEREKRSVSLDAVAHHTKVSRRLFADMERGQFDRWPPGIFGRAFIRGYADAVGLDADAVVHDYVELFPENDADRSPDTSDTGRARDPLGQELMVEALGDVGGSDGLLRLGLADDGTEVRREDVASGTGLKLAGALLDAALVLVPAGAAAYFATGTAPWVSAGLIGLSALVVATALVGGSPGFRAIASRDTRAVMLDVFDQRADDLFLSGVSRFDSRDDIEMNHDRSSASGLANDEGRHRSLVVSPEFYRPSDGRRFPQRPRHA